VCQLARCLCTLAICSCSWECMCCVVADSWGACTSKLAPSPVFVGWSVGVVGNRGWQQKLRMQAKHEAAWRVREGHKKSGGICLACYYLGWHVLQMIAFGSTVGST
jgi:hypothetical protein